MIQRRAARYVTNRYHNTSSVSDMLDQLEWPSLESRRTNSRLTMMYKMTKNLTNVGTSDKLIPLQKPSRNCSTQAFSIPSCKCKYSAHKFLYFVLHAHTQSGRIVNQMTEAAQRKKKKKKLNMLYYIIQFCVLLNQSS